MDMNHLLERSYCSIEIFKSTVSYEDMCGQIPESHPYHGKDQKILHFYDQPLVSVLTLENGRYILEILVDDHHDKNNDSYISVVHALEYSCNQLLHAALSPEQIPTLDSYKYCNKITRYKTISRNKKNEYYIITGNICMEDVPEKELPNKCLVSQGFITPTTRPPYDNQTWYSS